MFHNVYELNEQKALSENYFSKWFWMPTEDNDIISFPNTITKNSASIDLSKPKKPIVKFNFTTNFTQINQSITTKGTIKYNYVNNTVLDIPEEVITSWKTKPNYLRTF